MESVFIWLKELSLSHSVWGTVIGAIIGGGITLRITNKQIKMNEEQRIKNINFETKMRLINIQQEHAKDSMTNLLTILNLTVPLSELIFSYQSSVKNSKNGEVSTEIKEIKKQLLGITNPMRDKMLDVVSAAKICDMDEEAKELLFKLKDAVFRIISHVYSNQPDAALVEIIELPDLVEELQPFFREKHEKLILDYQNNLS